MRHAWFSLLAAWMVALLSTSAALFIGEVMMIAPCILCWYQRIFMFPLVFILGIASYTNDRRGALYSLPLAVGGLLVAAYHSLLTFGFIPTGWAPCSSGVPCTNQKLDFFFGIEMPLLSLLAFILIVGLLARYWKKTSL